MPWTSLTDRLQYLPLVLAGPIVRRTEPRSVTVWLALKEPRLVTLHILERTPNNQLRERFYGTHKTVRLGEHVHLIAVTAQADSAQEPLHWGALYYYNLTFQQSEDTAPENLYTPGILRPALKAADPLSDLVYPGHPFPSFVLPPESLEEVRLFHGSCRKTHGTGREMLAALDVLVEKASLAGPEHITERPQQLCLTGDQIYADDVTSPLLFSLIDVGQTLFRGAQEILPEVQQPASHFAPGTRRDIVHRQAMLTSKTPDNHLLSLAEYATMYLFSWSDVLWPSDLPTSQEVWQYYPTSKPETAEQQRHEEQLYQQWNTQLAGFRSHLPRVRRALANIATYMICDDHDVTDDWFLDGAWCRTVLSSKLGYRIIRNGLLAFSLFQSWGNNPTQFADTSGRLLLAALDSWHGEQGTQAQRLIDELIGMPYPFAGQGELERSDRALHWHYAYEAPAYQVVVMDTRTQRHYREAEHFPSLLSRRALQRQVIDATRRHAEVTFLISAAPVLGIDFIEDAQFWSRVQVQDNYALDREAWGLEWDAFQQLLKTLSTLKRVVILAGDVHYAFGSSMEYWDRHTGTTAKIINFTASPLCNEGAGEHMAILTVGYPRLLELLRRDPNSAISFFAWDLTRENHFILNSILNNIRQRLLHFWWSFPRLVAALRSENEIVLPAHDWLKGTFDAFPPDRSYRMYYLRNTLTAEEKQDQSDLSIQDTHALQQPQRLTLNTMWQFESIARHFRSSVTHQQEKAQQKIPLTLASINHQLHTITREIIRESEKIEQTLENHCNKLVNEILHDRTWLNKWKAGPLIVGHNNIGEIYFTGKELHEVRQRLWWWKQENNNQEDILQHTEYRASLKLPADTDKPPLP